MVLVAGDRQGVPSIVDESSTRKKLIISSLRELLLQRFDRDMTVSIVPVDGEPRTARDDLYELDIDNPKQRKESPEKRLEELSENLAGLQASVGESNALGALDTGGRATSSLENKTLYVYDSGISTAGPLAMQNGLLGPATDVGKIVEQLRTIGNIPQLTSVEVHWWGLGQVVAPQSTPPVWAKTKLRELWTAVVEAGGGSVVFHDDAVQATFPTGDLAAVTRVDFSDAVAEPVSMSISEEAVAFVQNDSVFLHKETAERTLGEVVSSLRASSVSDLWITGCTAKPVDASAQRMQELSEERAYAVMGALQRAGLTTTLHAKGLGPDCPGRVPETGTKDEVEAAQAKNRQVLITSKELFPVTVQG
jgi:outer membrane protein OmpA-like peptidoglycan-associated protein